MGGLSTWLSVDDPEYQLILDCNTLIIDIDNEIAIVHNFIRDNYRLKFPELESLVLHPIDYARVVRRIGNEMDLTLVDLEGLLPSATIMVVSVTASTTTGESWRSTCSFLRAWQTRVMVQFWASLEHKIPTGCVCFMFFMLFLVACFLLSSVLSVDSGRRLRAHRSSFASVPCSL